MIKAQQVRFLSKLALLAGATVLTLALSSLAQAQQRFNTPDAAVEALVAAAKKRRSQDRRVNSWPGRHRSIVSSGDQVADDNVKQEFLAAYDAQASNRRRNWQAFRSRNRAERLALPDSARAA